jgi:hypothetical protein
MLTPLVRSSFAPLTQGVYKAWESIAIDSRHVSVYPEDNRYIYKKCRHSLPCRVLGPRGFTE